MQVFINDRPVALAPGMTVRHALTAAGLLAEVAAGRRVYDEWGNEVGLDGGLRAGARLWVREGEPNCPARKAPCR
jgi:hypothetical protein